MATRTCKAAVFSEVGKPLELVDFDLPRQLEPGAVLCEVILSTICGSDLHTISGRRSEPTPLILGHEILGRVAELGEGVIADSTGKPLAIGDRVSWTIMSSCGRCYFCEHDLPQKCTSLRKYGHMACSDPPHLTGGYGEYVYLMPGTAIFKVPDNLPDAVAAPANCALATVVNAVEQVGISSGENVLIQGAGLLGLNLIALARHADAGKIFVVDVSESRLKLAAKFGADICLNVSDYDGDSLVSAIRAETDSGRGLDVAFEVCGAASAVAQAVGALRTGGRYLIAGLVTPGSEFVLDGNHVTRKCLTIKGIHNYAPRHLGVALGFLESCWADFPYDELVGKSFDLSEINAAVEVAAGGEYIRVAVRNGEADE